MSSQQARPADGWIKATASNQGANCVQLRRHAEAVEVRDSKHPHGPVLRFFPDQFTAWLDGAGTGEYTALTD